MHFLRDGGGSTIFNPTEWGDHPFVYHFNRGDHRNDAGKFAQFSRPPAPIVNDISLKDSTL